MNFIWDICLNAKNNGFKKEELFFEAAKDCRPWYEQDFSIINEKDVHSPKIEYNPLYRFSDLFQELLSPELQGFDEYRKFIFNTISHLLIWCDLHHGLSKDTFYTQRFIRDIKCGEFGTENAEAFQMLSKDIQKNLSSLILEQYRTGSSLLIFRSAIKLVFPDALLYQEKYHPKKLIIYLGDTKSNILAGRIQLLKELYLPMEYQVRIFWAHHFGVMDVDPVMKLDEIEIF